MKHRNDADAKARETKEKLTEAATAFKSAFVVEAGKLVAAAEQRAQEAGAASLARLRAEHAAADKAIVASTVKALVTLRGLLPSDLRVHSALGRALEAPPADAADIGTWLDGIVPECVGGGGGASATPLGLTDWTEAGLADYARSAEPSPEEAATRKRILEFLTAALGPLAGGPSQVLSGGSFAKGTSVKGKSDCDVVLVVPDFHPRKLPELQAAVQTAVVKQSGSARAEHIRDTKHGVKMKLLGVSVDIIISGQRREPGAPVGGAGGGGSYQDEYFFPGETVQKQVALMKKKLTPRAVEAVRVLKKWRNGIPWEEHKKPSSYFLELAALKAWKGLKAGPKGEWAPSLPRLLLTCFEGMLKMAQRPGKRVLLDVAQPSNNVAGTLSDAVWSILGRVCEQEVARGKAAAARLTR